MENRNAKPQQWVDVPLTKNGLLFLSGRLIRVDRLTDPVTDPNNPPRYKLVDISGEKPKYLSGLWNNGDHFGGDIKVKGEKNRFKLRKTENGFQEIGLSEAVRRWIDITQKQNTLDLDPLQPSTDGQLETETDNEPDIDFLAEMESEDRFLSGRMKE